MKKLNELLQQAKLAEAIAYLAEQLKSQPMDLDLRSSFVELLCVDGQLERADKQLDMMVKRHPQCLGGASSMRHLIRAAQARIDFANGADTAKLVREADESVAAMVTLNLAKCEENGESVLAAAQKLEACREPASFLVNDKQKHQVRDLDDSLAGYLELFGTNGQYYLVPLASITHLTLQPVTSIIELAWRRVQVEIKDGPGGDAFLPMTYLASETDAEKLGRETDWAQIADVEVFAGRGQKMLLVNEEALPLSQLQTLQLDDAEDPQPDATPASEAAAV